MKLWKSVVLIGAANGAYRYKGDAVYNQAGLDTSRGAITEKKDQACADFASRPQPNPPAEHVLGVYFESWRLDEAIRKAPWDKITHAYYSFTAPSVRCHIPISDEADKNIKKWVEAGKTKGKSEVRMIMALGGWAETRHFSWCTRNKGRRTKFVQSISAMVAKYGLDGVDIDWEHPRLGGCLTSGTTDVSDMSESCEGAPTDWMDFCKKPTGWTFHDFGDIAAYAQLGADLRSVLGYNSHISMTIGIGEQMSTVWCEAKFKDRYNFNAMCQSFNFLQLMTYDYMGLWNSPAVTSHHAALGCDPMDPVQAVGSYPFSPGATLSCEWEELVKSSDGYCPFPRLHTIGNIEWFSAPWEAVPSWAEPHASCAVGFNSQVYTWGTCPLERILVGVGLYGRGYCGVNSQTANGEYQRFTELCPMEGDTPVFVNYADVDSKFPESKGYKRFYNERTVTPFIFNKDLKYFFSYTDERHVKAVTKYTLCRGLGGVFFWAASGDDEKATMVNAAYDTIKSWDKTTGDMKKCMTEGGPSKPKLPDTQAITIAADVRVPPAVDNTASINAACCKTNSCNPPAIDTSVDFPDVVAPSPVHPNPTFAPTVPDAPIPPEKVPETTGGGGGAWNTGGDAADEAAISHDTKDCGGAMNGVNSDCKPDNGGGGGGGGDNHDGGDDGNGGNSGGGGSGSHSPVKLVASSATIVVLLLSIV